MRFDAIDGLRGWLAWAVVMSHGIQFCRLDTTGTVGEVLGNIGVHAVLVFIAISGFVICGRIIEVKEPWRPYITRRAFRIFPLYLFLLPFGALLLPYAANAFDAMPWSVNPSNGSEGRFHEKVDLLINHPLAIWTLHMGLAQGLIPDALWLRGSTALLPPSWSLSLEWQYYLVAPLFVWLLASKRFAAVTIAGVLGLAVLFKLVWPNAYIQPSFLPEAAYIFMVGILSRIWFERLQRFSMPSVLVIITLLPGIVFSEIRWVALWLAVLIYLLNRPRWKDDAISSLMDGLLDSNVSKYFGARSYSTYLVHFPIMYGLLIMLAPLELSNGAAVAIFAASAIALTAISSHLLYRFIEQPFIRLGSQIAKRQMALTV